MKRIETIIFCVLFVAVSVTSGAAEWRETYDQLLRKYVKPTGVSYQAWHQNEKDRAALKQVVDGIASQNLEGMGKEDRLAFYINAYNAWILETVLEHYPIESIRDISLLVFRRNSLVVAGEKVSFDHLENDVIREQFDDPRIHFVLNCASESCPPLHDRVFSGETLEKTMEDLTRRFINENRNSAFTIADGKRVYVSKLFEWYAEDFINAAGSVIAYLNKYRKDKIPAQAKVAYQTYDWTLNEAE